MNSSVRSRLVRAAFALAGFSAALAHAEGGCFVSCLDKVKTCKLVGISSAINEKPTYFHACRTQRVDGESGSVLAKFPSSGSRNQVVINAGESFAKLLAPYRVIDCGSVDSDSCAKPGMPTERHGKGFDPAAPWQAIGDPCPLGFPCGKIGLPPNGLHVRLADSTLQGRWRVFPARGKASDHTSEVSGGVIDLPAGVLMAGQTYHYQYIGIGSDGKVSAAGEFATLSQRSQQDSDAQLAEAMKQPAESRPQAVIDSLLLDGREWEAVQAASLPVPK